MFFYFFLAVLQKIYYLCRRIKGILVQKHIGKKKRYAYLLRMKT